jgi:hypothetical protein
LLLTYFSSATRRRAADRRFDIIEFANAAKRLLGDRRGVAWLFRLVEIAEPGIAVGVKNATKAFEMSLRMLPFAIRTVKIGGRRRRLVGPWTPVADIGP